MYPAANGVLFVIQSAKGKGGAMDGNVQPMSLEQLLEHFLIGALGLTLGAAIRETIAMPRPHRTAPSARSAPAAWVAWKTDRGVVKICGAYDDVQSQGLDAHVVYLEWWPAAGVHHEGWWRCDRRRPREWTKGYGGPPVSSGVQQLETLEERPRLDIA
jgi:hypothetical protein